MERKPCPRHHTERGYGRSGRNAEHGFTDSINAILADVPQERNTLLFSATMSPEIARISKKYLRDAKEITIGRRNEGTSNVKHVVFTVHAKDKYAALKRIVDTIRRYTASSSAVPARKPRKLPTN